ncbi:uncharacterized protein [Temnothorax nylanderi]|uniref:uncharacterized protein n=1 Tax=Temnothorax nylanderi TaxID=102681 RepID=UPI003A8A4694
MATGGGPSIKSVEIDPDIALIAPNLMKTAPGIYSSNLNDEEVKKRETLIMDFVVEGDLANVDLTLEGDEGDVYDDMLGNNNNCCEISDKENITPNVQKKMHAEKASLQPSESSSSYMTPSTKHFLGTESKKTQQSGEKLSLIKRGKRAIPSNDDENEISLKTRRIQKLFDQEVELNTLKIEHEKKCVL